jgi:Sigma-70 region 2
MEITKDMQRYCKVMSNRLSYRVYRRVPAEDIAQYGLIKLWKTPKDVKVSWVQVARNGMIDGIRLELGKTGNKINANTIQIYNKFGKALSIPHPDNPDNNKMYDPRIPRKAA